MNAARSWTGWRCLLPGAALSLVMGLGGHAAEPSAPDRLPAEVQGVVGSGDQLRLRLNDAAGVRTLRPGEAYRDGWMLKAVTASTATLAKDGQERVVGLNPENSRDTILNSKSGGYSLQYPIKSTSPPMRIVSPGCASILRFGRNFL